LRSEFYDKKDGTSALTTELVANQIEYLSPPPGSAGRKKAAA
jgi:hypothetical protein